VNHKWVRFKGVSENTRYCADYCSTETGNLIHYSSSELHSSLLLYQERQDFQFSCLGFTEITQMILTSLRFVYFSSIKLNNCIRIFWIMFSNKDNFERKNISRRDFVKLMGAGSLFVGLGALGIPNIIKNIREASAQGANATNTTNATGATSTNTTNATGASLAPTSGNSDIRPFSVNVPEAELTELRRRIVATRWPEKETIADGSQGVQLALMQALAQYWANNYDWRKVEAKLKALPQFITNIDGLDIHFIHVRSKHENALPLIVTHGWPGSPIEQMKIIDPLTNPTAHGASASDAFHMVIPSMAGYGFSGKPTRPGWEPARMARAWVELMKRLGYNRFAAQGGDWGAFVTNAMAQQAPPELIGIHLNFTGAAPTDVVKALQSGQPAPAGLSAEEQRAYDQLAFLFRHLPTQVMMAAHPQTLYGLADSPVALAAWMIDHDVASYGHIAKLFVDGEPYGAITRDDILDNITLSWLTNTGVSSARLYVEYKGGYPNDYSISVPAAVSVFPEEVYQAPRSWTERSYHNLIHFNALPKGGHFAAWEQPQLLSEEVRVGLRPLRQ
jgi:pimeloyl-ACP methyl ester carboxylesterase